jgi:hypothetical protein
MRIVILVEGRTEKAFAPHLLKRLTGSNRNAPGNFPEAVNHDKSPAYWLAEVFRTGSKTASYVKTRDAGRILQGEDLSVAIDACPELKSFVDTIVKLCGPKRKSGQGK